MAHEAGKGSAARPFSVSQDEYDKRWDAIFCRDLEKEDSETKEKNTRYNDETECVKENKF